MGRAAHGVKAINLEDGDDVVGMAVVSENATLLSVTVNGFGKRVNLDEYHTQHRGGKGLTSYKVNDKTGIVAGIQIVDETDDIMLISSDGVIIRINVDEIPTYSRYALGVHVMRVAEGTRLVTIARSPHEDEAVSDDDEEDEDVDTNEGADAENSDQIDVLPDDLTNIDD